MTLKTESGFSDIKGIVAGNYPSDIAVNPETNTIYVSNSLSNSITVIDGNKDKIIKTIDVGSTPTGISINPETNRVFVVNTGSYSISVIDGSLNSKIGEVNVGDSPQDISIDNNGFIYVTNWFSGNVSIIHESEESFPNITADTISIGRYPNKISTDYSSLHEYVYVTHHQNLSVVTSPLLDEIIHIPVGGEPLDVAVDSSTNRIFVTTHSYFKTNSIKSLLVLEKIKYSDDNILFEPINSIPLKNFLYF